GQAGDALQAFIWEQGLPAGSAFRYAPALKRWIAPVGAFVYNRQIAQPFMGFELIPWPNHASAAAQYHRPHDQPLRLHPDLARAAHAPGLPETLPPAGRPPLRMQLPARLEGAYHEYVNDRIVSVYQFTNVSGRSYSGIPRAGINAWDRETDF